MVVVLRIMGTPSGGSTPYDNKFVVRCNFEAGYGTLAVDVTDDPKKAMQFTHAVDAFAYWKTQSKTEPLRPDGLPNRPLTGVNMSLERL